MVRYGADKLNNSEFLTEAIDAAIDVASGTLSAMLPQLSPAVMAMERSLRDPIKKKAKEATEAVK